VNPSTVLTSALVAAVVTLSIEYFAKPGLEARKDRIVERQKRRRAVLEHVRGLGYQLGGLLYRVEGGATGLDDDDRATIQVHLTALIATIASGGSEVDDLEAEGISDMTATWSVILEPAAERPQGSDSLSYLIGELHAMGDAVEGLLIVPTRRRRKRKRAAAQLERLVAPGRPSWPIDWPRTGS
jgi:hypothetical protein